MFKSKREVDAHVRDLLSKVGTEEARVAKCLNVAKSYASIKEFDSAKRYLDTYLKAHPDSGEGLRLLGDIHWELDEEELALTAYKSSYDKNPNPEVLNRICDLLAEGSGSGDCYSDREKWFDLQQAEMEKTRAAQAQGYDLNASGDGGCGGSFLSSLVSRINLSTSTPKKGSPVNGNGVTPTNSRFVSHNFQPSFRSGPSPQINPGSGGGIMKTPKSRGGLGMITCSQPSPERMIMQMQQMEKKFDSSLERFSEHHSILLAQNSQLVAQNSQLLQELEGMKGSLRKVEGKVEALSTMEQRAPPPVDQKAIVISLEKKLESSMATFSSQHKLMCSDFKNKFEEIQEMIKRATFTTPQTTVDSNFTQATPVLAAPMFSKPPATVTPVPPATYNQVAKPSSTNTGITTKPMPSLKPAAEQATPKKPTEEPKPLFSFSFPSSGAGPSSFADLAKSSSPAEPVGFNKPSFSFGFGTGTENKLLFNTNTPPTGNLGTGVTVVDSATTPSAAARNRSASQGSDADADDFVPTAEFAPVIPLPPLVETKLGDENENVIFENRAKVYRFDSSTKEWKERGLGNIKILQDKDNERAVRVVMWREKVGKLACNHRITSDMKMDFHQSEKVVKWSAVDYAEEEAKPEMFTCKFGQEEKCAEFKRKFEEMVQLVTTLGSPNSAQTVPTITSTTPTSTNVGITPKPLSELFKKAEGSWDCSGCYVNNKAEVNKCPACGTLKPGAEQDVSTKPNEEAKRMFSFSFPSTGPSSFADLTKSSSPAETVGFNKPSTFSFGFGGESKLLFSNTPPTASAPAARNRSASQGSDADADDFVPTAEFAPVIPLPPLVETKLGDENENVIFENRAKVYRYDSSTKEWKERGLGNIKILQDKDNERAVRVVMWREKVGKLACNHRITSDMKMDFHQSEKVVKWSAVDYAEEEAKPEMFTCKFGQEEKCAEFKQKFEEMVKLVASQGSPTATQVSKSLTSTTPTSTNIGITAKPLSELFKKAEGSWDCGGCYVNNKADVNKCPACGTLKPGAEQEPSTKPNEEVKPMFSFSFPSTGPSSFADLTKSSSPAETVGFNKPNTFSFGFGGESKLLFSNTPPTADSSASAPAARNRSASQGSDADADDFVPTAEFAPVIPLPPLVETKLGDENENVIFENRAKVYRFDSSTKEWKERGLGNIKILQDKDNERAIRVVMWREKVGKLACNHRITSDMKMDFHQSEKVVKWSAVDYAEEEAKPEMFTCKFGQEEKCAEFKRKFEDMVNLVASLGSPNNAAQTIPSITSTTPTSTNFGITPKPLSELFRNAAGSWDCSGCYVNNKAEVNKCPACGTLKPGAEQETSTKPNEEAKPTFSFSFPSTGPSSFADLAKSSSPAGTMGFTAPASTFSFGFGNIAPVGEGCPDEWTDFDAAKFH